MDLMMGSEVPDLDVLIIGAGLSGLTSAIKILAKERSLNMRIMDENDKLGGQMCAADVADGGSKWINEEQDQMIRFMNLLHVSPRRRLTQMQQERCWDLDRGLLAHPAKFELNRYLNMLDARMIYYRPGHIRLRNDAPTMKQHIESRLFFRKSRLFMFNLVELTCGTDVSRIKFDEFMSVCSSSGGVRTLIDLYFNIPNTLLEVSSKPLLNSIMERIKYTEILYNRRARQLKHYKNYIEVIDSTGATHTAEVVILAIPWNKIEKIQFEPEIPKEYLRKSKTGGGGAAAAAGRRMVTSFIVEYSNSWWTLKGYSGSFLYSEPLIVGHEMRHTTYTGLTLHEPGKESTLRSLVLEHLAKYFGTEMLQPLHYQQFTYEISEALNYPLTTPWHRVIWSSTAAATIYRNNLGGAVQSGLRAAINALYLVRPQVVSWRDLLDLEYKNPYEKTKPSYLKLFFSRFNLYNVTFYGIFVTSLLLALDYSYKGHA